MPAERLGIDFSSHGVARTQFDGRDRVLEAIGEWPADSRRLLYGH